MNEARVAYQWQANMPHIVKIFGDDDLIEGLEVKEEALGRRTEGTPWNNLQMLKDDAGSGVRVRPIWI
jgi:hypothetical protein